MSKNIIESGVNISYITITKVLQNVCCLSLDKFYEYLVSYAAI